ncbi:MAG TPA: cupin domain-containing protein [Solirubrobacteraceae bacterium]|jgi:mannose-6-phosphate isomerase-like protein (cupin superfamily)|nr:cupin domain-containing protein [Solirubrobacteraceae bacterium]
MRTLRKVDFRAYERQGYEAQYLFNGESCVVIGSNVPPGAAAPPQHVHPVDQLYYIVEGEMNLILGSEHFLAGPDTLVFIPAGTPHHNWNEGSVDEFHFEVLSPAPLPSQPVMVPTDSDDAAGRPYLVRPLDADAYDPTLPGFSIQRLLRRSDRSEHMSLYIGSVDAGGAGPGTHVHDFDQFYYVLEGTMNISVGLDSYTATRHTLVVLPAGVPHRQWNEGPGPERHITLLAPEPEPGREPWDIGVELRRTGEDHT